MSARRVAVTGVGILCGLGANAKECWASMVEGRSAIAPICAVDTTDFRFHNGSEVTDFYPQQHFSSNLDLLDRFAQFALVAARQAFQDSGLFKDSLSRASVAIVTGTGMGGQESQDVGFRNLYREGKPRPHPFTVPRIMSSASASHISMEFGITGPALTVSTACASSSHAIGQAFWMVRHGLVEAAIAGGSEAPFSLGSLRAWEALRVVSPDTCRPFCRERKGMILGEGGAMVVLEPLERAHARGANIYAELAGFGMSSDAHHITQPSVDGPAAAIRRALEDAGISPKEIGYINAHGTGTPANDTAETRAIHAVFESHTNRLAVSSTKSAHGHALGAAGALEAFATVMALKEGVLPPTVNFTEADPACDLDCIPNLSRPARVGAALSNSFAFGGLNAVLLFRTV